MVMSGWSVRLTTLFLGRFTPPKRLSSTKCKYFRQKLPLGGGRKESKSQTGYPTQASGPQMRYRLLQRPGLTSV